MKRSQLFYLAKHRQIAEDIKALINAQSDFLSARSAASTRAVGDALQDLLAENFQAILGDACQEYSAAFARRAMADLAFRDTDNFYYVVDVRRTGRKPDFTCRT